MNKTLTEKIEEVVIKAMEDGQELSSGYNAKVCLSSEIKNATQSLLTLFQEEMIVKGAQGFGILQEEVAKAVEAERKRLKKTEAFNKKVRKVLTIDSIGKGYAQGVADERARLESLIPEYEHPENKWCEKYDKKFKPCAGCLMDRAREAIMQEAVKRNE